MPTKKAPAKKAAIKKAPAKKLRAKVKAHHSPAEAARLLHKKAGRPRAGQGMPWREPRVQEAMWAILKLKAAGQVKNNHVSVPGDHAVGPGEWAR